EKAEADEEQERCSVQQDEHPIGAANFLDLDHYSLVAELLGDVRSRLLKDADVELAVRRILILALKLVNVRSDVKDDLANFVALHLVHELAVAGFFLAGLRAVAGDQLPENHAQEDDQDPKKNCFCRGTRIHVTLTENRELQNP